MEENELYETIFKRKSIRNYDLTPLDQNTLAKISEFMDSLKPINSDIKVELKIISPDDVKRRVMKKAPHYIAVFSESKEHYLTNVGFMLQQMDLYLSASGIGSCWQGIPKPTKEVLQSSNLEFIILIAFGKPAEPLHRSKLSEFRRKPLNEISDIKNKDELLDAARFAPSAGNSQPWFFTEDKNMIHAYINKPSFVKGLLLKKYIALDVGIALYHLKLAAEYYGKETQIVFDKTAPDYPSKGYEYIASLIQN